MWAFGCFIVGDIFLSLSFCCCNPRETQIRPLSDGKYPRSRTNSFLCAMFAHNWKHRDCIRGVWLTKMNPQRRARTCFVEFGCSVHSLDGLFLTILRVPSTSLSIIFHAMEVLTPIDVYNFTIRVLLLMILSCNQLANRWNLVEKCAFHKSTMATSGNIPGKHVRSKKQNVYFPIVLLQANLRHLGLIHHPEPLPWWDFGRGVKEFLFLYPNPFEEFFKSNLSANNPIWLNSGLKPFTIDDLFPSCLDSLAESLSNGRKRTGAEGEICHGGWVGKIH